MFLPLGPTGPFLTAITNCLSITVTDSGTVTPMRFSSQVSQAVLDKWNHFCDLRTRICPHRIPGEPQHPAGSHLHPSTITGVSVPQLCLWWHRLWIETKKKRVTTTTFCSKQRVLCICRNWVPFQPNFHIISKPEQPLSGLYLLHMKLLLPFVL